MRDFSRNPAIWERRPGAPRPVTAISGTHESLPTPAQMGIEIVSTLALALAVAFAANLLVTALCG